MVDRRERMGDLQVAIQAALDGLQARIWTALPAKVESFNAAKATVVAQATVQPQVRQPDGSWKSVSLPVCEDCPVLFPSGGGLTLTFPLVAGDEGLLVFASRCIDAWWQQGDVQPQATVRMHDLSDGIFIPGIFSTPRVPASISSAGAELRNADRTTRVSVNTNGTIVIESSGQLTINSSGLAVLNADGDFQVNGDGAITGNLQINGNLRVTGTTQMDGAVTGPSISMPGGSIVITGNLTATGTIIGSFGGPGAVGLTTHVHPANNQPPTPGT